MKWANIHCNTLQQGENGVEATEDVKGLAFLNDAGEKIAVLDRQGNLRIKGDFTKDPAL